MRANQKCGAWDCNRGRVAAVAAVGAARTREGAACWRAGGALGRCAARRSASRSGEAKSRTREERGARTEQRAQDRAAGLHRRSGRAHHHRSAAGGAHGLGLRARGGDQRRRHARAYARWIQQPAAAQATRLHAAGERHGHGGGSHLESFERKEEERGRWLDRAAFATSAPRREATVGGGASLRDHRSNAASQPHAGILCGCTASGGEMRSPQAARTVRRWCVRAFFPYTPLLTWLAHPARRSARRHARRCFGTRVT